MNARRRSRRVPRPAAPSAEALAASDRLLAETAGGPVVIRTDRGTTEPWRLRSDRAAPGRDGQASLTFARIGAMQCPTCLADLTVRVDDIGPTAGCSGCGWQLRTFLDMRLALSRVAGLAAEARVARARRRFGLTVAALLTALAIAATAALAAVGGMSTILIER